MGDSTNTGGSRTREVARPRGIGLGNWRQTPFSRWAFSHVDALVPTWPIATQVRNGTAPDLGPLLDERATLGGADAPLSAHLGRLDTDVLLAVKDGRVAGTWTAAHGDANRPHLLFSVSKSVTGLLAGALIGRGLLDPAAPVASIVPETAGSAFGDARVRHLLDMQVSMQVDETYRALSGFGARYCRAVLWDPPVPGETLDHLSLLLEIPKGTEPHGNAFRYRSASTDMLGVVLERAAGTALAGLLAEYLWIPMGGHGAAHVTTDRLGMAQAAGGISCTAFDLARLGEVLRCEGHLDGRQVLPADFVRDTAIGGDWAAWQGGDWGADLPGHRYRNQWYARGDADGCLYAKGIHGQWLLVNPEQRTTLVAFSSRDVAHDLALDTLTLALLDEISGRL